MNIFEDDLQGIVGDMYRAWVMPEMFPGYPQPRLENWNREDLAAYCGGEFMKEGM